MKFSVLGILAALLVGLAASEARAELIYELTAEHADYNVDLGDAVDVKIFLRETASGNDVSKLVGVDGGLISAAVRLIFGDSAAARVLSVDDVLGNPGFTSIATLLKEVAAGSAGLAEDVDLFDSAVQGVEVGSGVVLLELGVFRFTGMAIGTTVVTVQDFDASQVNFVTAAFENLDEPPYQVLSSTFTINVNQTGVIPEPSSLYLAVCGGAAGLAAVVRTSRRRAG